MNSPKAFGELKNEDWHLNFDFKNLSGYGGEEEEEGGESRVYNSPKAFGELKNSYGGHFHIIF